MRTYYSPLEECTVYRCPHCEYTYHEYTDYDKHLSNKEAPFIQMYEALLTKAGDGRIAPFPQYACPSCGILQIDTSDMEEL